MLQGTGMVGSQHYTGNVPIIQLSVPVKSSANKDAVSKTTFSGNKLFYQWGRHRLDSALQPNILCCIMAKSQQRQNCDWTLICRALRLNKSSERWRVCHHTEALQSMTELKAASTTCSSHCMLLLWFFRVHLSLLKDLLLKHRHQACFD